MRTEPHESTQTAINIVKKLGDLPTPSVILDKAIRLSSNIESNINDLAKNISADQALTAKVIRISNSPIYGQRRKISSISEAIQVLGFNQIKSIIVTAMTFQMFSSCSLTNNALVLWHHSLSTAIAARLIVQKTGIIDKEEAYLAGLLHDIGKMALLKTVPKLYSSIIKEVKETNSTFEEIEMRELNFNHISVSSVLLIEWGFNNKFVSEIKCLHTCRLDQATSSIELCQILAFADSISKYIGFNFHEAYKDNIGDEIYLGNRQLTEDEIIELRVTAETVFSNELNSIYD